MKRLWVVIPLGALVGVALVLASIYGFYQLLGALYPVGGPSAASQHLAISRAVGGLKNRDEQEFLSAADSGDPAIARRAWEICSAALGQNPTIDANNDVDPTDIGITVTVPGDESKGCTVGLDWTGIDWLHHEGWAFAEPSLG